MPVPQVTSCRHAGHGAVRGNLVPGSRWPRHGASALGKPLLLERLDRAAGLGVEHAPADQFLGEVGR